MEPYIAPTVSTVCLGLVVEYWPFVGTCVYQATLSSIIYVVLLHFLAFASIYPTPLFCYQSPYIHWPNIDAFYKNHQNW